LGTPCVDNPAVVTDLLARSAQYAVRYHCLGSLTKSLAGEELAELGLMKRAGVVGFSDGGHPIASSLVFRRALQYAERLQMPVFLTPSDGELRTEGVMHEGIVSTRIGLRGIPLASEQMSVRRIEALTQDTGVLSCTLPIGDALNNLPSLKTGVSARSLLLSDVDIERDLYNPSLHIEPPLRSNPEGLVEAVSNGMIDVVFSHHTPLTRVEKECEFAASVPGAMGLETALASAYTALGDLRLIWQTMCFAPAALCHLSKGLHLGANVDIIVFDPKHEWVPSKPFMSKGINEPFEGRTLLGKVLGTLIGTESFPDAVRRLEVTRR
jgi:dihydroorotase